MLWIIFIIYLFIYLLLYNLLLLFKTYIYKKNIF